MPKTTKAPKTPRQLPVSAMMTAPTDGAKAGMRMKTVITKDMICAMRRPS